ncbi:MAG: hypothetical protein JRG79_08910 [Deltaproteobacteria bacterium]|nr:hypothetical protein [Deltaproteobacteria bacterium]
MRSIFGGMILLFFCNVALAQSPPFSILTISGTTKEYYNRVSLFEKGSLKTPFKTEFVSSPDAEYSIDIEIPEDMTEHQDHFFTDMRFWTDRNDNDVKDPGEPISQCHFIIWVPAHKKLYLKVYKGPQYEIKSSEFEYDYK